MTLKADYYYHACDPQVIAQKGENTLTLRFQTTEVHGDRYGRSGKHVHIELPTGFAMQLLTGLKAAQGELGLSENVPFPLLFSTPPKRETN